MNRTKQISLLAALLCLAADLNAQRQPGGRGFEPPGPAAGQAGRMPPTFPEDRERPESRGSPDRPSRGMDSPQPRQGGRGGPPPGGPRIDPAALRKLKLTPAQQVRIDAVFEQHRGRLMDLSAALQQEEARLERMLEDDSRDEAGILMQIDRVADARAELEKANARMLLGFRSVLTRDQWKRLRGETGGPVP